MFVNHASGAEQFCRFRSAEARFIELDARAKKSARLPFAPSTPLVMMRRCWIGSTQSLIHP
jgi:hypothetical protein